MKEAIIHKEQLTEEQLATAINEADIYEQKIKVWCLSPSVRIVMPIEANNGKEAIDSFTHHGVGGGLRTNDGYAFLYEIPTGKTRTKDIDHSYMDGDGKEVKEIESKKVPDMKREFFYDVKELIKYMKEHTPNKIITLQSVNQQINK